MPEIFIGLVGAVGTDLRNLVTGALQDSLRDVGYCSKVIHLSDVLPFISYRLSSNGELDTESVTRDKHIEMLMDAGDTFREKTEDGSAVATLSIKMVRYFRMQVGQSDKPIHSQAYIFRSLKRPEEVKKLREIYGPRFILISAYSPVQLRLQKLTYEIADSRHDLEADKYRKDAQELIHRDEFDYSLKKWGQNIRHTFPEADLFVDASIPDRSKLRREFTRFFELFFGNIFHTPIQDEYGMFHAYASARKSSSHSRRVGAAIVSDDGDIIAVGTNEVPKPGGGLYGPDDELDYRDFAIGYDTNERKISTLLGDILKTLDRKGYLKKGKRGIEQFVKMALSEHLLDDVHLNNVIEFIRPVHAEMAAIIDASRRTVSVKGCTLYCTTFPCHICAKHIVAAGIRRVVYIEPYPKSLAQELFFDSLTVDNLKTDNGRVKFESFVGIAPRRYLNMFFGDEFCKSEWKTQNGDINRWDVSKAKARFDASDLSYIRRESSSAYKLGRKISERSIVIIWRKVFVRKLTKRKGIR